MPKGISRINNKKSAEHYRWKPGGSVSSTGYVKVRVGKTHPLSDPNGYAYEHLLVYVSAGNPIPGKGMILHHKNHHKTDNRIENLEVISRAQHNALHNAERGRDEKGRLLPHGQASNLLDGVKWEQFPETKRSEV